VARIRNWLQAQGAVVYNIHGGDNFQEAGIPDLLCCYRGSFVGIEVKQPGEQPSKAQKYQLDRIRDAGGTAIVAETLDDVKQGLEHVWASKK
jgi:hypothetical protein